MDIFTWNRLRTDTKPIKTCLVEYGVTYNLFIYYKNETALWFDQERECQRILNMFISQHKHLFKSFDEIKASLSGFFKEGNKEIRQ